MVIAPAASASLPEAEVRCRNERKLNLRLRGVEEEAGEAVVDVVRSFLDELLGKALPRGVKIEGRCGATPVGRRHILIKCPNAEVKATMLSWDEQLKGTGFRIGEDLTRRQMEESRESWKKQEAEQEDRKAVQELRNQRTVRLDGMMEMRRTDDEYLIEWFFENVCLNQEGFDQEEFDELMGGLVSFRRVGKVRKFGERGRVLELVFESLEIKDRVLEKKRDLLNTFFFLEDLNTYLKKKKKIVFARQ